MKRNIRLENKILYLQRTIGYHMKEIDKIEKIINYLSNRTNLEEDNIIILRALEFYRDNYTKEETKEYRSLFKEDSKDD